MLVTREVRLPGGDEGAEDVAHVVEPREVDVAVLLPLVPLPLDRVPLVLQPPSAQMRGRMEGSKTRVAAGLTRVL